MLFRRISIRNFRKLEERIVIDHLSDGVTVIAGDNEEGKSTLLEAIRVGLFERHNLGGKALESMQPFGSSVRPEVSLRFEIDGQIYEITKGFAQKASSLLTTPSGRFEGAAAEERLAELLTFRVPSRGESKEDDRGVLGLFWLEQGRGLDRLEFGEMGRSTLRAALEDEVGDVLGGARGRKLLEWARARRSELLTATGRPRGELADAHSEMEVLSARVAELEEERRIYDREVDELARVRRELTQIEQDRVIEKAEEALAKAQEDDKAIQELRRRAESAKQAVELARAQRDNANERSSRRQQLIAAASSREEAEKKARESFEELVAGAKEIEEKLDKEKAACNSAIDARTAAEERLVRAQARARIKEVAKEQASLQRTISEVEKLAKGLATAKKQLWEIKISQEKYDDLQNLEASRREARAIIRAAATKVSFLPVHGQAVWKGEDQVPSGDPIEVVESAEFRLDGFGSVTVEPGAADLETRREQLKEIEEAYKRALVAAGVGEMAEAKSALASRVELEANTREATRLIAAHAPDGSEALKSLEAVLAEELEALGGQFEEGEASDVGDPEVEARLLGAAKEEEEESKRIRDAAQTAVHQHDTQLAMANRHWPQRARTFAKR